MQKEVAIRRGAHTHPYTRRKEGKRGGRKEGKVKEGEEEKIGAYTHNDTEEQRLKKK